MNLTTTLIAPLAAARTVAVAHARPWLLWIALAAIAVTGSLAVGASIALVTGTGITANAVWFTASAGIAWCLFGPALKAATRLDLFFLAHACLVAMAYGELVLCLATATNLAIHFASLPHTLLPTLTVVALANLTMAASLALQLRTAGVPVIKTIALWLVVLDGTGAALFLILAP